MAHANARTTVYARRLIVARVRAGHRPGEVATQLGISRQTVYKWVRRFRAEGLAGLADRSSRPHRSPRRTSVAATAAIVGARRAHHAGPVRLAAILGIAASTIGAVLARAGMPRLAEVDRLTGELLRGRRHSERRYERAHPGELLHVDVMKLGRIPDGRDPATRNAEPAEIRDTLARLAAAVADLPRSLPPYPDYLARMRNEP